MNTRNLVAFVHVADCRRSIDWYARLGFEVKNTYEEGGRLNWAWLESPGGAQLMVSRASSPVDPQVQGVLFYVYVDDVEAAHAELAAAGLPVGAIERPEHSPRGEFRVSDPDGYCVYLRHTD